MLDEAESKIFAIAEEGARGAQGFQSIQPLLTQVVERIDELYNRDNQSEITGVPTGFVDLDRMTSGLQPGDLMIVAGRPVDGQDGVFDQYRRTRGASKSACRLPYFRWKWAALNWPCVCSVRSGGSTSIALRTGRLADEDWPRLTHAIQKMNDAPICISTRRRR